MDALPADVLGYLFRLHVSPPGARRSYRDVARCAAVCRAWRAAIGGNGAAGACCVRRQIADDAALHRALAVGRANNWLDKEHTVSVAGRTVVRVWHLCAPLVDNRAEVRWSAVAWGDASVAQGVLCAVRDAARIFDVSLSGTGAEYVVGKRRRSFLTNYRQTFDDADDRPISVRANVTYYPTTSAARLRAIDVSIACDVVYRSHPAPYAMARAALRRLIRPVRADADTELGDFLSALS